MGARNRANQQFWAHESMHLINWNTCAKNSKAIKNNTKWWEKNERNEQDSEKKDSKKSLALCSINSDIISVHKYILYFIYHMRFLFLSYSLPKVLTLKLYALCACCNTCIYVYRHHTITCAHCFSSNLLWFARVRFNHLIFAL